MLRNIWAYGGTQIADLLINRRTTMDSLKMSKKKFTTTLDQVLIKDVKKLAIDLGLSANELIEEGIQLVLKKYRRKASTKKNLKAV